MKKINFNKEELNLINNLAKNRLEILFRDIDFKDIPAKLSKKHYIFYIFPLITLIEKSYCKECEFNNNEIRKIVSLMNEKLLSGNANNKDYVIENEVFNSIIERCKLINN